MRSQRSVTRKRPSPCWHPDFGRAAKRTVSDTFLLFMNHQCGISRTSLEQSKVSKTVNREAGPWNSEARPYHLGEIAHASDTDGRSTDHRAASGHTIRPPTRSQAPKDLPCGHSGSLGGGFHWAHHVVKLEGAGSIPLSHGNRAFGIEAPQGQKA